jgi:hypothetical protein
MSHLPVILGNENKGTAGLTQAKQEKGAKAIHQAQFKKVTI